MVQILTVSSCLNESSPEANSIGQNISYPILSKRVIEITLVDSIDTLAAKDCSHMDNVIAFRAASSINLAK